MPGYLPAGFSDSGDDNDDMDSFTEFRSPKRKDFPAAKSIDATAAVGGQTRVPAATWLVKHKYNKRANIVGDDRRSGGDDVTKEKQLQLAIESGECRAVQQCLEETGLNIVSVAGILPGGLTPVEYSASLGHARLACWMLGEGGAVLRKSATGISGLLLLASAYEIDSDDAVKCAQLLLQLGDNVNEKQKQGRTALMLAANNGHACLAEFLCSSGAKVNAVDNQGWTALMFSVLKGDGIMARKLINLGADPNVINIDGETAADIASTRGYRTLQKVVESASGAKGLYCSSIASPDKTGSGTKRNTELGRVLEKLNLAEYLEVFSRHDIELSQFLALTEEELTRLGIEKVGVRKKLLSAQLEMHKSEWKRSSLTHFDTADRKKSLRLSCPEVAGILANLSVHTRYIISTTTFIRHQVHNRGDLLLRLGGDTVTPDRLLENVQLCCVQLEKLNLEMVGLRRDLEAAGAGRGLTPVDHVASDNVTVSSSVEGLGPKLIGVLLTLFSVGFIFKRAVRSS